MAAYLGFWAAALAIAKRELDARFPRVEQGVQSDLAMTLLRERYARGEIDDQQYTRMRDVLAQHPRRPT